MIVFALSKTVWISIVALVVIGGADMVGVFVRGTLLQIWTLDELRGRVNAVNQVFIGASNEVGGFRAGVTAALIRPVGAVLIGGVGTLVVVGIWLRQFPHLAQFRELHKRYAMGSILGGRISSLLGETLAVLSALSFALFNVSISGTGGSRCDKGMLISAVVMIAFSFALFLLLEAGRIEIGHCADTYLGIGFSHLQVSAR